MHQFLFRRYNSWNSSISYKVCAWWITRSSRNCLADGTGGIYWKCLKIKKLQAGKPDSVVGYHLSVPAVTCRTQAAYPPSLNEPFSGDGICGISACKVYPQLMLPLKAVGSYPTFSPLPEGSYFLWHYLLVVANQPAIHRYIALCCPDFPPLK